MFFDRRWTNKDRRSVLCSLSPGDMVYSTFHRRNVWFLGWEGGEGVVCDNWPLTEDCPPPSPLPDRLSVAQMQLPRL